MLIEDHSSVSKLVVYLHDIFPINDPRELETSTLQYIPSLFQLLMVVAKVGSGALQLVKGNVMFSVMMVMRCKDEYVRIVMMMINDNQ